MKPRKKSKPSLLKRLFGGGQARRPSKGKPKAKPAPPAPAADRPSAPPTATAPAAAAAPARLSRLDRSIREIKQMASMGEKDPQRLALMLSRLLSKERQKQAADKDKLGELVQEILRRNPPEGGPPPGAAP